MRVALFLLVVQAVHLPEVELSLSFLMMVNLPTVAAYLSRGKGCNRVDRVVKGGLYRCRKR